MIEECLKEFVSTIESTVARLPDTRIGVVLPLGRPALKWYQDRLDDITSKLKVGLGAVISGKKGKNLTRIECVSGASQQFEYDKIHLTPAAGQVFIEFVLSQAEDFFESELVDFEDDDDDEELGKTRADLKQLEVRLKKIEQQMNVQGKMNDSNNLVLARIREEVDTAANIKKEDRVVMTGLRSATPLPTDPRQKSEKLKEMAMGIFKALIPDFKGKIAYVNQGKGKTQAVQMMEVKLDSVENAAAIRKMFAEKRAKKELPKDLDSLFITNCVNLATRVRIDVMKAIARKLSTKSELAYVSGFISRPMLHIKKLPTTQNARPIKSFTFIDSVTKFGHLVGRGDLDAAYSRAGNAFEGQVGQNFVVMNAADHNLFRAGASGGSGSSGKPGSSWYPGGGTAHSRGGARSEGWESGRGGKGRKRSGEKLSPSNKKNPKN